MPLSTSTPCFLALILISSTAASYDYADVLRKSLKFYQAQRSGNLSVDNEIEWRHSSHLDDAGEDGEDLSGGYYDAGDSVKFVFPLSSSLTVLSWGGLQYGEGYRLAGSLEELEEAVKWGTDFLIKCHIAEHQLYGQVGNSELDHDQWTRPEDTRTARPAYKITEDLPGSDLAAGTSSALAAASILLDKNPEYSAECLSHARTLYQFAKDYPGRYDESIKDAHTNYPSTEFTDEIVWAATWLFLATEDESYLVEAEEKYDSFNISQSGEFSWDDKGPGIMLLLAMITEKQKYVEDLQHYCDDIINNKPRSPKGMVFISKWGSLRHASNAAFICLTADVLGFGPQTESYSDFARQQLDYILGDSGHSFVVGFGDSPPQRPHHAASSCPPRPKTCSWEAFSNPGPNPQVLVGGLVGGPDNAEDRWTDDRTNYITNEVSLDYNAAFSGLVAAVLENEKNST